MIIATGTHWTAASALPAALAKDQRCGYSATRRLIAGTHCPACRVVVVVGLARRSHRA